MTTSNAPGDPSPAYTEALRHWTELNQRAEKVMAGGAGHDSHQLRPVPPFFERARGPYKWSGGHRCIDYWMGHGALLLGHAFPPVVAAVIEQMQLSSHLGGTHEAVVRWAELVCELIPSAERVRFTSSGTEATLLAIRVARAFTGRNWLLKLDGHFHGWHDEAMAYFVDPDASGMNPGTVAHVAMGPPDDAEAIDEFLAEGNVAAVLLEPGGGSSGAQAWSSDMLRALRESTRRHGTLLIFDEVVSGFRYSPGGVQALCGVRPDVTVLGKILCGGLPGGAVAGSAEVMQVFGSGVTLGERQVRVPHTGTFNANPLSAVAGVTMLEHVRDGSAQERARRAAARLVEGVNAAAEAARVDVQLYTHDSSIYHVALDTRASGIETSGPAVVAMFGQNAERYAALRRALLLEGVDSHPLHGWVSAAHDDEAIDASIAAFERAFRRARDEARIAL